MAARKPYWAEDTGIELRGLESHPWRDAYNLFLRVPWSYAIGAIVGTLIVVNLIYGTLYWLVGGIEGMTSFAEAFFFSVETLATVGYGAMHPVTTAAHVVTMFEIFNGILLLALTTGLVFGKFSMPTARVMFTTRMCIGPIDGVPTLMFRVANERGGQVLNVAAHLIVGLDEPLKEGGTIYRMRDLRLHRERIPTLARTWTGMHQITQESPLYGLDADALQRLDAEFLVTLSGTEYPTAQPYQAAHSWIWDEITFGARFADMFIELPDGRSVVEFSNFDVVVPTVGR